MLYKLQFFQKLAFEIQLLKVDEVFFIFFIAVVLLSSKVWDSSLPEIQQWWRIPKYLPLYTVAWDPQTSVRFSGWSGKI